VTLSRSIGTTLTFNGCQVKGYITSSTCSGGADDSDNMTAVSIPAGSTLATQGNNGLSCADLKYVIASTVTINGTIRHNGDTFAVGSDTCLLVINNTTCSVYPC